MNSSSSQAHNAVEMSQDWQTCKATLVERAKHLLMTGLYSDCQFLVSSSGSNPQLIKAHKLYLAQSSPVFDAMFFGKMTEGAVTNELVVSIPDLSPSSFKDLLQYIYTDSVDLLSVDQAIDLCYAAKKYILPNLVAECVQYTKNNLYPEHACRVLEFTNLFEDDNLKEKCLSLLREQTIESLAPLNFEELSESTALFIVKEEKLNISELKLFDAVVRWAGHQCAQRDLEVNGTNMRQMLGEIIGEIRFLAMKPDEFASSPSLSGILTREECFAIFMNLVNRESLQMPLHLTYCRNQRNAFFVRRKNRGLSILNDGVYCSRNLAVSEAHISEQITGKVTSFAVDRAVIFKGVVLIAGLVLTDKNDQDVVLVCRLLDPNGVELATAKVSQPLPRHFTTMSLEPVFNCSIRLERGNRYRISVSVSQRAHCLIGMASTASCQGVGFHFSPSEEGDFVRGLIFNLC